jgi:hypothetical protein
MLYVFNIGMFIFQLYFKSQWHITDHKSPGLVQTLQSKVAGWNLFMVPRFGRLISWIYLLTFCNKYICRYA